MFCATRTTSPRLWLKIRGEPGREKGEEIRLKEKADGDSKDSMRIEQTKSSTLLLL